MNARFDLNRRAARALVVLILLLAGPVSAANFFGNPTDAANVFRNAMATGEIATVLGLLSPEVLVYDAGREDRSREAYAAHNLKRDMARIGTFYAEVLNQVSSERGDAAWVTTRTRYLSTATERPVQFVGTETLVLLRLGGGWQIVHVHRSVSAEEPAR